MTNTHNHPSPNCRDTRSHIDDIAMEWAFNKRSNDRLAHMVIRATYLVAGAMACKLFITWIPRRSNVGQS